LPSANELHNVLSDFRKPSTFTRTTSLRLPFATCGLTLRAFIHCHHPKIHFVLPVRSSQAPKRHACSMCIHSRSEAAASGGSTTSHIATLRKNMGFLFTTTLCLHFNSPQNDLPSKRQTFNLVPELHAHPHCQVPNCGTSLLLHHSQTP
jgi:hypothetical protein